MKNFIVQGGENSEPADLIEPIKNEFHQRLRFTRRGLAGMATNEGSDNNMQFFFTLDQTPELQNTHTIFGKISGDTIYNALKLGETPTDHHERPLNPHKINKIKILHNPFADIKARVDRIKSSKDDKKNERKREGVKNFKLISFGDEAEQDEMEVVKTVKKTETLQLNPSTSSSSSSKERKEEKRKRSETPPLPSKSPEKSKSKKQTIVEDDSESDYELSLEKEKKSDIERKKKEIQNQIKDIKRQYQKDKKEKVKVEEQPTSSEPEKEVIQDYLDEKEKYKKQKENTLLKGPSRESFTLQLLAKFKNKLQTAAEKNVESADLNSDDENWLGHKLDFSESADAVLAKDASKKADDWYDIHDPRNPLNKRKRGAEKEAKNKNK